MKPKEGGIMELLAFENKRCRLIIIEGRPWFAAKDVCDILGLANPRTATERLGEKLKDVHTMDTPGGRQAMTVINEGGLYKLAFTSRKPEAERFTSWVASEVLPSIRETGAYLPANLTADFVLRLGQAMKEKEMQVAAKEKELGVANQKIKELAPKAEAYDVFIDAQGFYSMEQAAKILNTGRNRLFALLRKIGLLQSNNVPYQRYIDARHFALRPYSKKSPSGHIIEGTVTLVTSKGLDYIRRKTEPFVEAQG